MPPLKTCCGCIDLRSGCLIIGYLQLIAELFATTMVAVIMKEAWTGITALRKSSTRNQNIEKSEAGLSLLMLIIEVLLLIIILAVAFTITFLVGIHKNKRAYVKIYMAYSVICMGIWSILSFFHLRSSNANLQDFVLKLLSLLLNIYFLLVVRSYYLKMGAANVNGQVVYIPEGAGSNGRAIYCPGGTGYPPVYRPGGAGYPTVYGLAGAGYPVVYDPGAATYDPEGVNASAAYSTAHELKPKLPLHEK